jgi:hypothetical protein
MMVATSVRLAAMAEALEDLFREFLLKHADLEKEPQSGSDYILVIPTHYWAPLDDPGRAIQAKLRAKYARFSDLVAAVLRRAPEDARTAATEAEKTVSKIIDQSSTYSDTVQDVLEDAIGGIRAQVEQVNSLYDPTPGQPVFVPDANAVVWNPDLEEWTFDDAPRFSIVLTSTLLDELDDLKMPYRGESVRDKAEGVIRRIKEYGRRGDIHAGVTLRGDRSTVRMTAVEPDFDNTLPWLDRTIKDDRLLAACLEIVREHPHSPVVLVTRDINMQNKARHAGIPFVEPPDPPAGAGDEPPRRRGPRPDVRILDLYPTGGGGGKVDFAAHIQNYGTQPNRATVTAAVNGQPVNCRPNPLDLLVNTEPSRVAIDVPRPELGELVFQFNSETTLYGRELVLLVTVDDEQVATETWRESVYDSATEPERHAIQERVWRRGHGQETEEDRRAEELDKEERLAREQLGATVKTTQKWYDDGGDIRDKRF